MNFGGLWEELGLWKALPTCRQRAQQEELCHRALGCNSHTPELALSFCEFLLFDPCLT